MLIVDAHLDLSMNALQWNRDLLASVYTVRTQENYTPGKGRGRGTVAFPEMRRGRVAVSFATLIRAFNRPAGAAHRLCDARASIRHGPGALATPTTGRWSGRDTSGLSRTRARSTPTSARGKPGTKPTRLPSGRTRRRWAS